MLEVSSHGPGFYQDANLHRSSSENVQTGVDMTSGGFWFPWDASNRFLFCFCFVCFRPPRKSWSLGQSAILGMLPTLSFFVFGFGRWRSWSLGRSACELADVFWPVPRLHKMPLRLARGTQKAAPRGSVLGPTQTHPQKGCPVAQWSTKQMDALLFPCGCWASEDGLCLQHGWQRTPRKRGGGGSCCDLRR